MPTLLQALLLGNSLGAVGSGYSMVAMMSTLLRVPLLDKSWRLCPWLVESCGRGIDSCWILSFTCLQGVTKRFRLSWLTNGAFVYEPKCEGRGGGGVAGSQPMSTAVNMEPK